MYVKLHCKTAGYTNVSLFHRKLLINVYLKGIINQMPELITKMDKNIFNRTQIDTTIRTIIDNGYLSNNVIAFVM